EYSFDKRVENVVLASLEGMEDAATLGVEAVGVLDVAGKVPKYLEEDFKDATLIGDKMNPNSEVILGLNPDVIVGTSKFGEETMTKLNKIAVTLPYSHISANWKDNLLALAEITGKVEEGNKIISGYEEKASKTKEKLSNEY
ncbi:ABC transporter substrate-binding protein, partial [Clostridium perfringens]|nr:ABC transporter substrate-binding protein [Clostridium perfringens]